MRSTGPFEVSSLTWKTSGTVSLAAGASAFFFSSDDEHPISATQAAALTIALAIRIDHSVCHCWIERLFTAETQRRREDKVDHRDTDTEKPERRTMQICRRRVFPETEEAEVAELAACGRPREGCANLCSARRFEGIVVQRGKPQTSFHRRDAEAQRTQG